MPNPVASSAPEDLWDLNRPGYERRLASLPPLPRARWRRAIYRVTRRKVRLG